MRSIWRVSARRISEIRSRSLPVRLIQARTIISSVKCYSSDSRSNIYAPVPSEDLKNPFETLESLVNDRSKKLELPALLMAVNVSRLQKSPEDYKRYYDLLMNIFDRSVASDRHFHFPQLVNECYKAAYKNKDKVACNTLWEKSRLILPGRSIDPEVYAFRILEFFNQTRNREAMALVGDLCRRFIKTPGSLTVPLDMILERLSAVPAHRDHAEQIVMNFNSFKVPKSVSTYTYMISMAESPQRAFQLEAEMKSALPGGPVASVRLTCALIRAAGNSGERRELERVLLDYVPLIEKMYERQPDELQKALKDIYASYEKFSKRFEGSQSSRNSTESEKS